MKTMFKKGNRIYNSNTNEYCTILKVLPSGYYVNSVVDGIEGKGFLSIKESSKFNIIK